MKTCLLIDFGASRVKSAILNLKDRRISAVLDFPLSTNASRIPGRFEISCRKLKRQFEHICSYYYRNIKEYDGIFISSQMHGFVLFDGRGRLLTDYISWKDERSLEKIRGEDTFSRIDRDIGAEFHRITGMKLRPGLPFSNIIHLAREGFLKKDFVVLTLPEFFCFGNNPLGNAHNTMAVGTGFYDIHKKEVSNVIHKYFKNFSKASIHFNKIVDRVCVSGYIRISSRKIPIFTGVGNFQCAVLGAGNAIGKTIAVNIGTGSQVCVICKGVRPGPYEIRPYFGGLYLKAFTHIPAGRVLQEFISLTSGKNDLNKVWDRLKGISLPQIESSTLCFDLNIFKSSWKYEKGGGIFNIDEGSLTKNNYCASLLKNFMLQYAEAIWLLGCRDNLPIILSGGIPRKLTVLAELLARLTGRKASINRNIEETLSGLRILALAVDGKERVN